MLYQTLSFIFTSIMPPSVTLLTAYQMNYENRFFNRHRRIHRTQPDNNGGDDDDSTFLYRTFSNPCAFMNDWDMRRTVVYFSRFKKKGKRVGINDFPFDGLKIPSHDPWGTAENA